MRNIIIPLPELAPLLQDDAALNVPQYNGGLFRADHPKNQFLADHKVSDNYLVPALELLTRDPETDWANWIKEDGNIVRSTQSVYRFELSDNEARYWQQAFEVLEEFENSHTFPGDKTRTTHAKLIKTKVPVFDDNANIAPLIELRDERAEVNQKIEKTDGLIDQVVYQLYGLSEEEIAVVEKSV